MLSVEFLRAFGDIHIGSHFSFSAHLTRQNICMLATATLIAIASSVSISHVNASLFLRHEAFDMFLQALETDDKEAHTRNRTQGNAHLDCNVRYEIFDIVA